MAEVIWASPALAQADAIIEFIALDKPDAAAAVAARLIKTTDHLEQFVLLGRPVPEYPHENYRQVWIKPCWVYYRKHKDSIFIVHVRRAEKPLNLDDLFLDEK